MTIDTNPVPSPEAFAIRGSHDYVIGVIAKPAFREGQDRALVVIAGDSGEALYSAPAGLEGEAIGQTWEPSAKSTSSGTQAGAWGSWRSGAGGIGPVSMSPRGPTKAPCGFWARAASRGREPLESLDVRAGITSTAASERRGKAFLGLGSCWKPRSSNRGSPKTLIATYRSSKTGLMARSAISQERENGEVGCPSTCSRMP